MKHFFQNLTIHQAEILILVIALACYAFYQGLKQIKACDNEPEIEEDEN